MRILHTADWHMNNRLGRLDISHHIIGALEQIASLLEERQVDVMVVAGDIFSERSRPDELRTAIAEIRRLFLPFLSGGGTIIAIAGNHDSEVFFETLRDALSLAAPGSGTTNTSQRASNNYAISGGLHITATPDYIRLCDVEGIEVQFALMPYPTPRCYLRGENINCDSIEQKHYLVQQGYARMLQTIQEKKIDPCLPSVLVSHIHVRGAQTHSLYKISETEDVIFNLSDIPTHWAYAAYGHIHRPGPVREGYDHVRYCGSVARLDAAERDDAKSVVLVDIGQAGCIGPPEIVPLRTTPFYQIEIHDPDTEIEQLTTRYPDADVALVHYTLHWQPDKHNLNAISSALDKIFPNCYNRDLCQSAKITRAPAGVSASSLPPLHDVAGTVRRFLEHRFQEHPERADLLSLADKLLAEDGSHSE